MNISSLSQLFFKLFYERSTNKLSSRVLQLLEDVIVEDKCDCSIGQKYNLAHLHSTSHDDKKFYRPGLLTETSMI